MVATVGVLSISSWCRAQALPERAVAAPTPTDTPAESVTVDRWYGAPILLADGAAYAAMIGGYASHKPELAIGGAVTYALSGPITHLAFGHYERAGSSLLLRLGVPVAVAVYGAMDCQEEKTQEDCGQLGLALGGFSMFVVTVVDGAFLANDRVERRAPRVLPTLSVNRDGAVLGAVGTF
jgi:hypothetical protein